MRLYIGRKMYDSSTAQIIAVGRSEEVTVKVMRKRSGEFFLHSVYQSGNEEIVPISFSEAKSILGDKMGFDCEALLASTLPKRTNVIMEGESAVRLNEIASAMGMSKVAVVSELIWRYGDDFLGEEHSD